MKKAYNLEAYHWDRDYWSTVGTFDTRELALNAKKQLEDYNPNISCSIFEKDIIIDLAELISV